jgi:hypothetical protein
MAERLVGSEPVKPQTFSKAVSLALSLAARSMAGAVSSRRTIASFPM